MRYQCQQCGKVYDSEGAITPKAVSHVCPKAQPGKPRVRVMVAV